MGRAADRTVRFIATGTAAVWTPEVRTQYHAESCACSGYQTNIFTQQTQVKHNIARLCVLHDDVMAWKYYLHTTGRLWGNPSVTLKFPSQAIDAEPVVFIIVRINKQLNKQSKSRCVDLQVTYLDQCWLSVDHWEHISVIFFFIKIQHCSYKQMILKQSSVKSKHFV